MKLDTDYSACNEVMDWYSKIMPDEKAKKSERTSCGSMLGHALEGR